MLLILQEEIASGVSQLKLQILLKRFNLSNNFSYFCSTQKYLQVMQDKLTKIRSKQAEIFPFTKIVLKKYPINNVCRWSKLSWSFASPHIRRESSNNVVCWLWHDQNVLITTPVWWLRSKTNLTIFSAKTPKETVDYDLFHWIQLPALPKPQKAKLSIINEDLCADVDGSFFAFCFD